MMINHNIVAIHTHRKFGENQHKIEASFEKLSSGERINRAGDDAAGLAISEKLRAQINGLDMAYKNAEDGIEDAARSSNTSLEKLREFGGTPNQAYSGWWAIPIQA